MSEKYAKGKRAWGICGRSGRKMLLRDMVMDGRYPNLKVDPDWYESRHPQETLPRVEDPVALYRPSPEVVLGPSAPVITSATQVNGVAQLLVQPSEPTITEIKSYDIYRSVDGGAFSLLISCAVQRDFLGGVTGIANCVLTILPENPGDPWTNVIEDSPFTFSDPGSPPTHTYCYYLIANPMGNNASVAQGPPSTPSNTACVTILGIATAPVLSGNVLDATDIGLTWTASSVSGSTIGNYQVYRQVDGGAFSLLTTVSGSTLAYTDSTVASPHVYDYYVVAVPVVGINSPNSNTVQFGYQATTPTLSGSINIVLQQASLSWTASTVQGSTIAHYELWRSVNSGSFSLLTSPVGTSYVDSAISAGNYYSYEVRAVPVFGQDSGFSNMVQLTDSLPVMFMMTQGGNGGAGGYYIRSNDGVNWTQDTLTSADAAHSQLCQAAYSPSLRLWLVTDYGAKCLHSSPDGVTWTKVTMPVSQPWTGVCWSPRLGLFAAFNPGPASTAIATSPDGATWTSRAVPFSGGNFATLSWVTWANSGNGIFVVRLNTNPTTVPAFWSTDGITWNSGSINDTTVTYVGQLVDIHGHGINALWGSVLDNLSQFTWSSDGEAWTWMGNTPPAFGMFYLPSSNQVVAMSNSSGTIVYSIRTATATPQGSWPTPQPANITPPLTLGTDGGIWPVGPDYSPTLGIAALQLMSNNFSGGYHGSNRILTTSDGINWKSYLPTLTTMTALQYDSFNFGLTASSGF